jgi:hypothetical protein
LAAASIGLSVGKKGKRRLIVQRDLEITFEVQQQETADAIAKKWVGRLGLGFHPDTRGANYSPALSANEIREYDADMDRLFQSADDPYDAAARWLQGAER